MKHSERMVKMLENYHIPMNEISIIIAMHFKMEMTTIKSSSREGHIVRARNFCIYFLHKYLTHKVDLESTKQNLIGLYLLRDRLTIRHHQMNFAWLISHDREIKEEYNELIIKLNRNGFF